MTGALNRRVAVQVCTPTRNTFSEKVRSYADSFFVWAQIITTGGSEFYAAQKLYAQTTAVMRVRYTTRIKTTNRIRYGNQVYEILAVNDENAAHKYLLLTCKGVT